jgi:hypothetical protein
VNTPSGRAITQAKDQGYSWISEVCFIGSAWDSPSDQARREREAACLLRGGAGRRRRLYEGLTKEEKRETE